MIAPSGSNTVARCSSRSHVNYARTLQYAIIHAARNVQRKRAQGLNSLLWVWPVGVAKTNATIVALVATAVRFLAKPSPFFAIFDNWITIIAHKSA